jgi:hypothetical protein
MDGLEVSHAGPMVHASNSRSKEQSTSAVTRRWLWRQLERRSTLRMTAARSPLSSSVGHRRSGIAAQISLCRRVRVSEGWRRGWDSKLFQALWILRPLAESAKHPASRVIASFGSRALRAESGGLLNGIPPLSQVNRHTSAAVPWMSESQTRNRGHTAANHGLRYTSAQIGKNYLGDRNECPDGRRR